VNLSAPAPTTRVLLLVEDNPGDADLVREMLEVAAEGQFQVHHVTRLNEAIDKLKTAEVDVVLLDLRLPDGSGVQSVESVRSVAGEVPIVVLTGTDDEKLALSCIDAGAQDFLFKGEVRPVALRRAIGYAITRLREAQLRELQDTLERYRELTGGARTSVTASLAGMGALRQRLPAEFTDCVGLYRRLVDDYLEQLVLRRPKPRHEMERLATVLGDAGAGPRDLLDVHVSALDEAVKGKDGERSRSLAVEGRLLALEMMGLLLDYYRMGLRRRFVEEETK
jgi:CheY-like chemotaxis protein